jgi:hypothetical protein
MKIKLMIITTFIAYFLSESSSALDSQISHPENLRKLISEANLKTSPFPSFDPMHPPPAGSKNLFQLVQEYPQTYDGAEFPWMKINFSTHPNEYLKAILNYCLEGNTEIDFRVEKNTTRKWFHAPWLHADGEKNGAGREYHHGLTRERRSREQELHRLQMNKAQNWAVGFYNDRGGYTLGKVWLTPSGYPDPSQANFPDNTVAFKLLFTDAPVGEVPFLMGSKEWQANIYPDTSYTSPRIDKVVRLLQIDVAVKDPRVADSTGWVFGTFIYDGSHPGTTVWDRMIPVGLSWGDNETVTSLMTKAGAFINTELSETRINSSLVENSNWNYKDRAYVRHYGIGGRLNGPVDNPVSSCISCHGRAGNFSDALPFNENSGKPMEFALLSISSPTQFPEDKFEQFFRLIRANSHLETINGEKFLTTDYSLQVSAGIRNFYQHIRTSAEVKKLHALNLSTKNSNYFRKLKALPLVSRETDQ